MPSKYANIKKLTKDEQEHLFIRFAKSLACLKGPVEAGNFIRDLLSEQEVLMLARRLQIADLLLQGLTYEEIRREMKVGPNTVAKVQLWLNMHGEGFKAVVSRVKDKDLGSNPAGGESWRYLKKKAPMYFWPEILLEEIVKSANKKERERLKKIIGELKDKSRLNNSLKNLLD